MNRRTFLESFIPKEKIESVEIATVTSSLEAWIPDSANPWDASAVNHLYHRFGFGATHEEFQKALNSSPSVIIQKLMNDDLVSLKMPPPPDGWQEWLNVPPYEGPVHDVHVKEDDLYHTAKTDIRCQWTVLMTQPEIQLREKLTLFWHNHFVVEEQKIYHTQMMFRYFDYLRRNAWGNFKQMVKDITIMPAMLVYLSGISSEKNALNENYAREVMELFTMGRVDRYGNENYTQEDVRHLALALTGWRFSFDSPSPDILLPYFAVPYFDFETKTSPFGSEPKVYGLETASEFANFKVDLEKIQADVIELLFEKRESQIAWFICKKLYRAFVYDDATTPEAEKVIEQLASQLIGDNWEMKPVLLSLFQSEHFFDLNFRGAAIKSPYEYMCGMMRKLNIPITEYQAGDFWWFGMDTNQWLCNPPNVKGWPGYHAWLNSATLPKRNNEFAKSLILNRGIEGQFTNPHSGNTFDPIPFTDESLITWAKQFPDYEGEIQAFVSQVAEYLCAIKPDDDTLTKIINSSGILHTYEWPSIADAQKAQPIRMMLYTLTDLPHFQLC